MINQLSTAGFVPPSVYKGPLFVLPKKTFRTVVCGAPGLVFWANRPAGVLSYRAPPRRDPPVVCLGFGSDKCFKRVVQDSCPRCPGRQEGRLFPGRTGPSASRPSAPPRPAALPCAAPPRPARDTSGFWIRQVSTAPSCSLILVVCLTLIPFFVSGEVYKTIVFVILGVEMEGRPLADKLRATLPSFSPAPMCSSHLAPKPSRIIFPQYIQAFP